MSEYLTIVLTKHFLAMEFSHMYKYVVIYDLFKI